jgi:CD109 antigen
VLLSVYQPSYSYNYYGGGGIMGRPAMMADSMLSMPSSDDSVVIDGASATLLATMALYTAADGTAAFSVALPTGMMGSSARAVSWSGAPLVLLATVIETATGETLNGAWCGQMLAGAQLPVMTSLCPYHLSSLEPCLSHYKELRQLDPPQCVLHPLCLQRADAAPACLGTASIPVAVAPLAAELTLRDAAFKPGLPFSVTVSLTRPDGAPAAGTDAPGAALLISASRRDGTSALSRSAPVALDADGVGSVDFAMPRESATCCNRTDERANWSLQTCCVDYVSVSLTGVPGVSASAGASNAASASGEYLTLGALSPAGPLPLGATLSFTPAATAASAQVRWALLGPGGAVASGAAGAAGTPVRVAVPPSAGAAPTLLAWFQSGSSLIFDWTTLAVTASLPQSLSAGFDAATAQPGDDVTLSASGSPACRVFFAARDTSLMLMGSDAALTAAGVLTAASDAGETAVAAAQAAAAAAGAPVQSCWTPPPQEAAGAALLTALALPACVNGWRGGMVDDMVMMEMQPAMAAAAGDMAGATADRGAVPSQTEGGGGGGGAPRVRSVFPETWVWAVADADATSGVATLAATAPDTMTSWQLCAFSVHPTLGLAIAPTPASLAVSQPFYVRAQAPYALVRGERFLLRVGVFSNLSVPVDATVSLVDAAGAGFDADATTATVSLPAGGAAGVAFALTPSQLGALTLSLTASAEDSSGAAVGADALRAPILVIAEGIPAERTHNVLLRAGGGAAPADAAAVLSAPPPAGAVPCSARATLSVVGDLMGQTLAGLGALLTVPSGCGEQNMIGMAPNVAVLGYLAATPAATPPPALAAAAASNAATGYQRQLTYRHADGSFSAFGESDASGSTWLTAFVLKVFSAASAHITVDDTILQSAASWLLSHQQSSGAFDSIGSVIHTEMVSGATSSVSLTGFVLAALLEAPPAANVPSAALDRAAAFLAASPAASGDAYAAQLRAFALARACAAPAALRCADAATALAASAALAVTTGGLRHWEAPRDASAAPSYWQAPPADIELTGYGVLTLLAFGRAADATDPARWLVAQRNGGGGFASTQDTVVGLAALAGFAAATYATPPALSLAVSGDGVAAATSVAVDAQSAALLQQLDLPAGVNITVAAAGMGTVLVQLTTRYNMLAEVSASASSGSGGGGFTMNVSGVNVTGGAPGRRRTLLASSDAAPLVHTRVCATREPGASRARQAGMVILEAGLFSGYTPVASSLAAVQASNPALIKRIEVDTPARRVLFYLDALPVAAAPTCVEFDSVQDSEVFGLTPATSRVYSYYAPSDAGAASLAVEAVSGGAERPPSGTIVDGVPSLAPPAPPAGAQPQPPPPASGAQRASRLAAVLAAISAGAVLVACTAADAFGKAHTW